ncbi:MAG: AgmX/PglI C-terminal domain-containing protein [Deltaproteobacteria bacterium]
MRATLGRAAIGLIAGGAALAAVAVAMAQGRTTPSVRDSGTTAPADAGVRAADAGVTSPFGALTETAVNANGNMTGDTIGDTFGYTGVPAGMQVGSGWGGAFTARDVRLGRPARAEEPRVTGALGAEAVRRVAREHFAEVARCCERARAQDPRAGGRVTIEFVVGADGSVHAMHLARYDAPAESVGQCVGAAIGRWRFPPLAGRRDAAISYPFVFEPSAQGDAGR